MTTSVKKMSCLIVSATSLALLSCIGTSIDRFDGLEQRVNRYYQLEQNGDWESAYAFHTPAYRQMVPREGFLADMKKDDKGWKLVRFKITSVKERDEKVYLRIAFVVIPPLAFFNGAIPSGVKIGEFEMEDESIWVRMAGEWYCYTPGTRQHLSLNAPLVSQ